MVFGPYLYIYPSFSNLKFVQFWFVLFVLLEKHLRVCIA